MAQDTQKVILDDLKSKYKKLTLTVDEVAKELGVSKATIHHGVKSGIGVPAFKQVGIGLKRKKYVFPLNEIARFLSDTQKMY